MKKRRTDRAYHLSPIKPIGIKPRWVYKLFIGANDAGVSSSLPGINYCIFFDTGDYYLSWIFHQYHIMTPAITLSPVTTSLMMINCQYQWHRRQFIAWNNNTWDHFFITDVNYTVHCTTYTGSYTGSWKKIILSTPSICYGKIYSISVYCNPIAFKK